MFVGCCKNAAQNKSDKTFQFTKTLITLQNDDTQKNSNNDNALEEAFPALQLCTFILRKRLRSRM